jgi:hypothetical protein
MSKAQTQAEKDEEMKRQIRPQLDNKTTTSPSPSPVLSQAEKDAEMKRQIKAQNDIIAGSIEQAEESGDKDEEMNRFALELKSPTSALALHLLRLRTMLKMKRQIKVQMAPSAPKKSSNIRWRKTRK